MRYVRLVLRDTAWSGVRGIHELILQEYFIDINIVFSIRLVTNVVVMF